MTPHTTSNTAPTPPNTAELCCSRVAVVVNAAELDVGDGAMCEVENLLVVSGTKTVVGVSKNDVESCIILVVVLPTATSIVPASDDVDKGENAGDCWPAENVMLDVLDDVEHVIDICPVVNAPPILKRP